LLCPQEEDKYNDGNGGDDDDDDYEMHRMQELSYNLMGSLND
jgi:hypothetical protein